MRGPLPGCSGSGEIGQHPAQPPVARLVPTPATSTPRAGCIPVPPTTKGPPHPGMPGRTALRVRLVVRFPSSSTASTGPECSRSSRIRTVRSEASSTAAFAPVRGMSLRWLASRFRRDCPPIRSRPASISRGVAALYRINPSGVRAVRQLCFTLCKSLANERWTSDPARSHPGPSAGVSHCAIGTLGRRRRRPCVPRDPGPSGSRARTPAWQSIRHQVPHSGQVPSRRSGRRGSGWCRSSGVRHDRQVISGRSPGSPGSGDHSREWRSTLTVHPRSSRAADVRGAPGRGDLRHESG